MDRQLAGLTTSGARRLAVAAAGPSAGTVTRQYSRACVGSSSPRSAQTAAGSGGA